MAKKIENEEDVSALSEVLANGGDEILESLLGDEKSTTSKLVKQEMKKAIAKRKSDAQDAKVATSLIDIELEKRDGTLRVRKCCADDYEFFRIRGFKKIGAKAAPKKD